jgi:hypothetical protein
VCKEKEIQIKVTDGIGYFDFPCQFPSHHMPHPSSSSSSSEAGTISPTVADVPSGFYITPRRKK